MITDREIFHFMTSFNIFIKSGKIDLFTKYYLFDHSLPNMSYSRKYVPYLLAPLNREDEKHEENTEYENFMESKYEEVFENVEDEKEVQICKKERCSAKCVSGTRKNLRCKRTVLPGNSCCAIHMKCQSKHVQFSSPLNSDINEENKLEVVGIDISHPLNRNIEEENKNWEIVELKDAETQTDFDESSDDEPISTVEELWIDSIPSYIA